MIENILVINYFKLFINMIFCNVLCILYSHFIQNHPRCRQQFLRILFSTVTWGADLVYKHAELLNSCLTFFLSYSFRKCRHTHTQNYFFHIGCYFKSKTIISTYLVYISRQRPYNQLFEKYYFGRSKVIRFEQNSTHLVKFCHFGKFKFLLTILVHGIGNTLQL